MNKAKWQPAFLTILALDSSDALFIVQFLDCTPIHFTVNRETSWFPVGENFVRGLPSIDAREWNLSSSFIGTVPTVGITQTIFETNFSNDSILILFDFIEVCFNPCLITRERIRRHYNVNDELLTVPYPSFGLILIFYLFYRLFLAPILLATDPHLYLLIIM